jgi:hypothetical protein
MRSARRKLAAVAACLAGFGVAGAAAQQVADKPDWKPGDTWMFRSVTTPGDKEGRWTRKVEEVSAEKLGVRVGDKVETYDGAFNFLPQGRADYVRELAKFPMKVGDEWPMSRKFDNPVVSESGKAKVAAYEEITVPAGTYGCYRVEADVMLRNQTHTENRVWKRWYCPQIKWIAKEVLETRVHSRSVASGTTIVTSELVKFTPGP